MKKLISLLAALAVVTTGTAAFATDFTVETKNAEGETVTSTMAATGDEATIGAIEADEDGLYTVDLATVAGDQDQTTILAVEGKTIKVGSIKYINQSDATSFTFGMDAPADTVYVLAGGSAINPTLVAKIEVKADEPETFTISGTVTGFAGTTLPTVVANDGTTDYAATVNADGTFTVDVPAGATYTLKASKTGYLSYTKNNVAAATDAIAAIIKAGDTDASGAVNLTDLSALLGSYNTAVETIEKDFDESGAVNLSDLSALLGNYNAGEIIE